MHAGGRVSLLHGKRARRSRRWKLLPAQGRPGSRPQAQLRDGLRARLMGMKTLNIGLLVDSVHADKYVEELALWGKSRPEINISHLIVHPYRRRRPLRLLPSRIVFQAI